ncbi:methionine ABC transporter ATP-binding protein [Streptomyces luridiscabiei]|uniref:methionine ABC transporter ATP-binding protein n=1 Tax=Streptomyces luridiscabiei TaxID=164114 RepID=UPI003AF148E5
MIEVDAVRKTYAGRPVVDGVSFSVDEGEIFGILGPNGAGKTTTVECVEGLRIPDAGTVKVAGLDPVADHDRVTLLLGAQLQESELQAKLTVREALELYSAFYPAPADWRPLAARLGLEEKLTTRFAKLSGGQKQRVGIARALAGDPKVLLSDEATSALDPETTRSILQLLRDLNQQLGLTILLITHEMDVVKTICDSAALMQRGRIVESGTVGGLLSTPGSELASELFPVGGTASGPDRTVVDVTFHGEAATQPVISQLSRTYNIDISILGAAMDTVGGKQIGRMRIELPGRFEENVVPIGFLREQGLQAEVVEDETGPKTPAATAGSGAPAATAVPEQTPAAITKEAVK